MKRKMILRVGLFILIPAVMFIFAADLFAGGGGGGRGGRGMARLDTDGDGKVTKAEYMAAFTAADVNGDGELDETEMSSGGGGKRGGGGREGGGKRGGGGN
jgi:hypothetical protein